MICWGEGDGVALWGGFINCLQNFRSPRLKLSVKISALQRKPLLLISHG